MGLYVGVDGVIRQGHLNAGVGGVARNVDILDAGVGGAVRKVYGTTDQIVRVIADVYRVVQFGMPNRATVDSSIVYADGIANVRNSNGDFSYGSDYIYVSDSRSAAAVFAYWNTYIEYADGHRTPLARPYSKEGVAITANSTWKVNRSSGISIGSHGQWFGHVTSNDIDYMGGTWIIDYEGRGADGGIKAGVVSGYYGTCSARITFNKMTIGGVDYPVVVEVSAP